MSLSTRCPLLSVGRLPRRARLLFYVVSGWVRASAGRRGVHLFSLALEVRVYLAGQRVNWRRRKPTSAKWSLQQITLPSAESRSSMRWILTASGMEFRRCCSSWSVVVVGTSSPFRLLQRQRASTSCQTAYPAVNRPMMRVPAIVAWQMGMTSCNSASKMLCSQWGIPARTARRCTCRSSLRRRRPPERRSW